MKPGSLVICKMDGWRNLHTMIPTENAPVKGEIYTVVDLVETKHWTGMYTGLILAEFPSTEDFDVRAFDEIQPPMDIQIAQFISEPQTV